LSAGSYGKYQQDDMTMTTHSTAPYPRFADRCVVVLGGNSGIGLAAARLFRAEGAKLALTGRNEETLRAAAEELDALAIRSDIGAPAESRSAMAEIFGKTLRTAFAGAVASRWGQDVYARGAWSVARDGQAGLRDRIVLAQPHDGRIFFAGEATDGGDLAGAHSSGVRSATEALTMLARR